MTQPTALLPVAIIGAGPVGLAALAHLVERGLPAVLFEAGQRIAQSYEDFRHVRLFSPWRFNVDRAAARLLAATGWQAPDAEAIPSAGEVIDRYLAPLAALPAIARAIRFDTRVTAISRRATDRVKSAGREQAPFVLRLRGADGETLLHARAVIDASGTWSQPNPLGADGLPALGEAEHAAHIRYGMPDILGAERARYAGRSVLVVGAGHSAAGNLLALAELAETAPGMRIVWAIRSASPALGGGTADGLPARGAIGMALRALLDAGRIELVTGFRVHALRRDGECLAVLADDPQHAPLTGLDEIICSTGARPDLAMLRELRTALDPALESSAALGPLIDPNVHSCGTVRPHGHRELAHPEPGFYVVGAKSYGRAPTFLMATGYDQVRSVVAALAGELAAADEVRLELPETGVCSTDPAGAAGGACCTAEPQDHVAEDIRKSTCCTPASKPADTAARACCA